MAHARLRPSRSIAAFAAATLAVPAAWAALATFTACGGASKTLAPAPSPSGSGSAPASAQDGNAPSAPPRTTFEGAHWGRYDSRRFELSLGLPDGAGWAIDDHRTPWLSARHAGTRSTVLVRAWSEDDLATRASCYARARGWDPSLPDINGAPLVDDRVRSLGGAMDARVAVGIVAGRAATALGPASGDGGTVGAAGVAGVENAELAGFAVASGASVRRCLVLVFRTAIDRAAPSAADQMAGRLALATEGVFASLRLDDSLAVPQRDTPASGLPVGGNARARPPSSGSGGLVP